MARPVDECGAPPAKEFMTPPFQGIKAFPDMGYMASPLDFCSANPVLCSSSACLQVWPCRSGSWYHDSEDNLSGGVAVWKLDIKWWHVAWWSCLVKKLGLWRNSTCWAILVSIMTNQLTLIGGFCMLDSQLSTEVKFTAPYGLWFSPRFSFAEWRKAFYIPKEAGFYTSTKEKLTTSTKRLA